MKKIMDNEYYYKAMKKHYKRKYKKAKAKYKSAWEHKEKTTFLYWELLGSIKMIGNPEQYPQNHSQAMGVIEQLNERTVKDWNDRLHENAIEITKEMDKS
jgi:hypothetical protein